VAAAAATAWALTRPVAGSGVRTRVPSMKLCRLFEPKTGAFSSTNSCGSPPGASIETDRPRPPGEVSGVAGLPPVTAKRATTGRRTPSRRLLAVESRAPAPVLTHSPAAQTPLAPERRRPGRAPPPLASMPLTISSAVGAWAAGVGAAGWAKAAGASRMAARGAARAKPGVKGRVTDGVSGGSSGTSLRRPPHRGNTFVIPPIPLAGEIR
jgi:hypothetical protein